MRIMYDSTTAAKVPVGGDLYAGYVNGWYPSYDALVARFGRSIVVPCSVLPGKNSGIVGDGPPDNGTWPEWVKWVEMRRAAGVDPTMYTSMAEWATARTAFADASVAEPHWWIANWTRHESPVPTGAVALQWQSTAGYDVSIVVDYWPGVDIVQVANDKEETLLTVRTGIVAVLGKNAAGQTVVATSSIGSRATVKAWSFIVLADVAAKQGMTTSPFTS